MEKKIKLACQCGEVTGELELVRKNSFHVKCLCCDCQTFASHMGAEARILDSHGGTELFQTYPSYVTITKGAEHIASVRLSADGLLRHYANCCNTPIGNMMSAHKVPFIGIPVTFMQFTSEDEKNELLGPLIMEAFAKYARNGKPDGAYDRFPLSFLPKIMSFMAKGFLQKKYLPSPYFKNGKPISTPEILSKSASR